MRRFAHLHAELGQLPAGTSPANLLGTYFTAEGAAAPASAACAAWLLGGALLRHARQLPPRLPAAAWREAVCAAAGIQGWLYDECRRVAGDLADTVAHVLPHAEHEQDRALAELLHEILGGSTHLPVPERALRFVALVQALEPASRRLLVSVAASGFRPGVSRLDLQHALAPLAGTDATGIAPRLQALCDAPHPPSAADWQALIGTPAGAGELRAEQRPRPFAPAQALPPEGAGALRGHGDCAHWQVQWRYRGCRAQVLRHAEQVSIWGADCALLSGQFPEVAEAARTLHAEAGDFVLDGVLLAWLPGQSRPLAPSQLARRMQQQRPPRSLLRQVPARFVAFDLLAYAAQDLRASPLRERGAALQALLASRTQAALQAAPTVPIEGSSEGGVEGTAWSDRARALGHSGLVLKHLDAPYPTAASAGLHAWWSCPLPALVTRVLLVYAESPAAIGAAATYSFALWNRAPASDTEVQAAAMVIDEGEPRAADPYALRLVPVAKLPVAATDARAETLQRCLREHALQRFGPVTSVMPTLVAEIGCDAVSSSPRHRSGLVLMAPRLLRLRPDLAPREADTLAALRVWL